MPKTRKFEIKNCATYGGREIKDEEAWLKTRPTVIVTITPASDASRDVKFARAIKRDVIDELGWTEWSATEIVE